MESVERVSKFEDKERICGRILESFTHSYDTLAAWVGILDGMLYITVLTVFLVLLVFNNSKSGIYLFLLLFACLFLLALSTIF